MPWEETEEVIRSGHKDVDDFQPDSLRTIWASEKEGIKAVIGKKNTVGFKILSVLLLHRKI